MLLFNWLFVLISLSIGFSVAA